MKQLILFDCDGTLTDSNMVIVRAIQGAFADHGVHEPRDQEILAALGMSLDGVVEALLQQQQTIYPHALVAKIATAYRLHYAAFEKDICLYPDVLNVLKTLKKRGYWMAIVTGKSKNGLIRVIERFHLQDYFYAWRTADCCRSKPHPEMALQCMQELGFDAAETTLLGDSHFDMQMAKAAGVKALGASFDGGDGQCLYAEGAEKVLTSFEELLLCFPEMVSGEVVNV